MAKIHGLLDIGRRGMSLSQTALQTTSHNIANKSTEGYSRQRVDLSTNPAIDEGRYRLGTGAQLANISRTNSSWIEKQIEREGSQFSFTESRSNALNRVETVLNEQSIKGLNAAIGDFFGSFREMANNPESAIGRTQVREAANNLINTFKDADRQIKSVRDDLNKGIEFSVGEVNGMAKEIAQLNERIQTIEITGGTANDERDRRDLMVKKLSEKIDISYAEDPKSGMLNITAGQTAILVAGTSSTQLKTYTNQNNQMAILHEMSPGGTNIDISEQFKRGSIGGAIDTRDTVVGDLTTQLESLAYNISTEVNKAHVEGYDRYNKIGSQFFDVPQSGEFTMENLALSKDIQLDVGRIATASKPNAPGDNTVANVIHALQFKPLMEDGKYSFDDFYNSKVGEIGVLTQRTNSSLETQKTTLDQLKNTRESISGVSLDEEAAKMMEFQKSFEASARMIKVADEMFDTVLNLKRL